MRVLLLGLLLLVPALADPPADTIKVYVDPSGQLHLENPPAREVELQPTLPRDEPPQATVYRNWLWYDPWDDPAWLYLYGQYPQPYGPSFWPGPDPFLTPYPCW